MREKNTDHLSAEELERFFTGGSPRREIALVVRHLLSSCKPCMELAAAVASREGLTFAEDPKPAPEIGAEEPGLLTDIFLKLLESRGEEALRLAHERLQGIGLLSELEMRPPEERLEAVRNDPRFHHWGLFDRILMKYLEYARNSPATGVELVLVGMEVLDRLPTDRYHERLLADFRAAAYGALGNAQRLAGSFAEARLAFEDGWEAIEDGTGDPIEEANLLSLEASLCYDLGELDRSGELLERAATIYEAIRDDNRQAKTIIQQALAVGYLEPLRGIELLRDALRLLDAATEPRLELCARHNLAWFLNDAGEPQEALSLLEVSRPLYRSFADQWTQLRLHWLEGRIALTLGDLSDAEAVFRKISHAFEKRGMHLEQTMVAIDLVEASCRQDHFEAALRLIRDFLPVLSSWGMHVEGLAMWKLFEDSVASQAATRTMLETSAFRGISLYFYRAWNRPMHYDEKKLA